MKIARSFVLAGVLLVHFALNVRGQEIDVQPDAKIALQAERLRSDEIETRRDAAHELRLLENHLAAQAARAALNDSAEIVRATAAEAAAFLPDSEAAAALSPLLAGDKSEFVRREAAFALGAARSRTAVAVLIQALQTDKAASVRAAAAIALGKIADARALNVLADTLLAPDTKKNRKVIDEFVRRSAARALGAIQNRAAAPALITALRNPNNADDVRREVAVALGAVADAADFAAIRALRENLNAPDYLLAEIAAAALRRIETRKLPEIEQR